MPSPGVPTLSVSGQSEAALPVTHHGSGLDYQMGFFKSRKGNRVVEPSQWCVTTIHYPCPVFERVPPFGPSEVCPHRNLTC